MNLTILTTFKCKFSGITFRLLANHHHLPSPELVSSCKTETLYPLSESPFLPPPARPWQPPFYFLSL